MKIAIFTDSYYPAMGGTEVMVHDYATKLANFHEVLICCPKYKGNNTVEPITNITINRCKSIKLTNTDYFTVPGIAKEFQQAIDEFQPDIIHCQTCLGPLISYGIKYGKRHNLPIVFTIHTDYKSSLNGTIGIKSVSNYFIKNIVKKLNQADAVVTVSNNMKNKLHEYGFHGDVLVIKNDLNVNKFPEHIQQKNDSEVLNP